MKKTTSFYLSIFFLICASLLLIFFFYKDQIFNAGLKNNYYKIYYFLGIFLFCYAVINFFLKENLRINSLLIIISFISGLYLIEFLLLVSGMGNFANGGSQQNITIDPLIQKKIKIKKDYDTRSLIQFYEHKYIENKNIVLGMYPNNFLIHDNQELFPLSGISYRETILCNENGYYATYQSDRYGFNNPDNLWNNNEIDFMMFGDSFLHGSCVYEKDSIVGHFKKISPKKTALNLGYGGTGPLTQLATLKEYLPTIKAKNILWFYYEGNDLRNLHSELKNEILFEYLNNKNFTQKLRLKQDRIDNTLIQILEKGRTLRQQLERNSRFKSFLKLTFLRRYVYSSVLSSNKKDNVYTNDKNIRFFIKIIESAKKISKKNNSNFYFIYIPHIKRLELKDQDFDQYKEYKLVKKKLKEIDVKIIDLYDELFLKIKDPLVMYPFKLRVPSHFSEYGYKLMAETVRSNF